MLRLLGVDQALLDIAGQTEERLFNVDVGFGRHLHERYAQLICQCLALFCAHRSLLFPVTLVADEDLVDAFCRVLLYVREPRPDICFHLFSMAASASHGDKDTHC